ncbi:hypothetical protein [Rhizobium sp. L51/94]|uniref:hypothetical protein n=1 Tax=Rhizobium sp. L51/94 TaxID=2819999 RepID=UPI001C5A9FE3|nr:hypothetical protein [Rhizobium sp. L51/94]QXZ79640.1 hypothetical protein J5274_06565 [Rhizobium sp. L51/94]
MAPDFDRAGFSHDVRQWLDRQRLSYRAAVAAHPSLNPAMLSRACHQKVLSVASVLMLARVIGLDPMAYLVDGGQQNQAVTASDKRETLAVAGRR